MSFVLKTKSLSCKNNVFDVVLIKLKSQSIKQSDMNISVFGIGVLYSSDDTHTSHSVVDMFEQLVEANINELNINIKQIIINFLVKFIFISFLTYLNNLNGNDIFLFSFNPEPYTKLKKNLYVSK